MNVYIKAEITQMQLLLKNFELNCERASKKDDGQVDREEQKILIKIKKASKKFSDTLESIK